MIFAELKSYGLKCQNLAMQLSLIVSSAQVLRLLWNYISKAGQSSQFPFSTFHVLYREAFSDLLQLGFRLLPLRLCSS